MRCEVPRATVNAIQFELKHLRIRVPLRRQEESGVDLRIEPPRIEIEGQFGPRQRMCRRHEEGPLDVELRHWKHVTLMMSPGRESCQPDIKGHRLQDDIRLAQLDAERTGSAAISKKGNPAPLSRKMRLNRLTADISSAGSAPQIFRRPDEGDRSARFRHPRISRSGRCGYRQGARALPRKTHPHDSIDPALLG